MGCFAVAVVKGGVILYLFVLGNNSCDRKPFLMISKSIFSYVRKEKS